MIPIELRQPADIVMWHNTCESHWQQKAVNHFSDRIPGDRWGYCHCGLIFRDVTKIIHCSPPRASINTLIPEKGIIMELWRVPGLTPAQGLDIVDNFFRIAFIKKGNKYIGRRYDWLAILSLGLIHNPFKTHCAEGVGIAYRDLEPSINLFPKGEINGVLQPNQIILSNKARLIYKEKLWQ